jgi:hypothetical protein
MAGTLYEDQYAFFFCHILLSSSENEKCFRLSCRKNRNTYFTFHNFFFNCAMYGIMWKNVVEWSRLPMTIWCVHISCWMPKATNTFHTLPIMLLPNIATDTSSHIV